MPDGSLTGKRGACRAIQVSQKLRLHRSLVGIHPAVAIKDRALGSDDEGRWQAVHTVGALNGVGVVSEQHRRLPVRELEGLMSRGVLLTGSVEILDRRSVLAAGVPEDYAEVLRSARHVPGDLPPLEQAAFGETYAVIGAQLLESWRIPPPKGG